MRKATMAAGAALVTLAVTLGNANVASAADTITNPTAGYTQADFDREAAKILRQGNFKPPSSVKVTGMPVAEAAGGAGRIASRVLWPIAVAGVAHETAMQLWPDYSYSVGHIERDWLGITPDPTDPRVKPVDPSAIPLNLLDKGRLAIQLKTSADGTAVDTGERIGENWDNYMANYWGNPATGNDRITLVLTLDCKTGSGSINTRTGYWPYNRALTGNDSGTSWLNPATTSCGAGESLVKATVRNETWGEHTLNGDNSESAWNFHGFGNTDPYRARWWGIQGNTTLVAQPTPKADNTYTVKTTCKAPGTGSLTVKAATLDGAATDGATPACTPEEGAPVRQEISSTPKAGGTATVERAIDFEDRAEWAGCDSATPCLMTVSVDGQLCTTGVSACQEWTRINQENPSRVECKYGPYVVATSECFLMERSFSPTEYQATESNTDGDPNTGGEPTTVIPPATTSPAPGTGTGTGSEFCNPNGSAWDLINGIKCALEWAFVPSQATLQAQASGLSQAWARSGPGNVVNTIGAWAGAVPSMDGCEGPRVQFDFAELHGTFYPMNACEGPLATIAPIGRAFGAVALYLGAALAISRYMGATIGFKGLGGGDH